MLKSSHQILLSEQEQSCLTCCSFGQEMKLIVLGNGGGAGNSGPCGASLL